MVSTDIQRWPVPVLAHSLSVVEWSHLLGTHISTHHIFRLTSSQASALPADLCLLSTVSVLVMTIPLAAHLMAQSAPLMIACFLISNLNSPCCILIPLLLLHWLVSLIGSAPFPHGLPDTSRCYLVSAAFPSPVQGASLSLDLTGQILAFPV